ncbi:caspase-7-like [Lingula anatina]|uniref:Caspase-7-like n=1 Tax=Lingula anatina TaxID=7574 RepID=A0A1S3J3U0_LINAN|nr:caspase-7-like [Lingula anatina]XP_023930586.1 caspase-7-like [Lingula anatina]|eukprot:XP_013405077.1 caspase-7-like [Lingula anatina]
MSEENIGGATSASDQTEAEDLPGHTTDISISAQLKEIKKNKKLNEEKGKRQRVANVPPGWQDDDCYPITDSVGKAIIFYNKKFDSSTSKKTRMGKNGDTENDANQLKSVLEKLGFTVKLKKDYTVDRMLGHLQNKVAAKEFGKNGCFLCIVLTQGEETTVEQEQDGTVRTTHTDPKTRHFWGIDRSVTVDKLVRPFKGDKCHESLAAIPKIFIIQVKPVYPYV